MSLNLVLLFMLLLCSVDSYAELSCIDLRVEERIREDRLVDMNNYEDEYSGYRVGRVVAYGENLYKVKSISDDLVIEQNASQSEGRGGKKKLSELSVGVQKLVGSEVESR